MLAQRVGQRDPVAIRQRAQLVLVASSSRPPPTSRRASGRTARPPRRPRRRGARSAAACPPRRSAAAPRPRRARSGSRRASRRSGPSPCARRSASTRSDAPGSVNHWLPAASIASSAPVAATLRAATRAPAPRCPSTRRAGRRPRRPVSSRSSCSSATVRDGSSGTRRGYNALACGNHSGVTVAAPPRRQPRRGRVPARRHRVLVVAALWGLWEGYKWLWETTGWTWPFAVDDTTMPHLHDVVAAFWQPTTTGGPPLIDVALARGAGSPRKEALAGFLLGARDRLRARASCSSQSRLLERGILPYIVASQTVPILAIAPMVVVGLGSKGVAGWKAVAILAAYLTFFPVAINTLRGLHSVDPRAVELMRLVRGEPLARALAAARAVVRAVHLHRAQDLRDRERDRRDHRRDAGVDPERPRRRDRQLQPVLLARADVPLGDERRSAPRSASCSSSRSRSTERLVLRRAPEHVA